MPVHAPDTATPDAATPAAAILADAALAPPRKREPALPLQPGETYTGPHRHDNGDYFFLVTKAPGAPGAKRRQVYPGTSDLSEARAAEELFARGEPFLPATDLLLGPILQAAYETASKQDRSRIKALLPFWSGRTVGEFTPETCREYCRHKKQRAKGLKRPSDSYLREQIARMAFFVRATIGRRGSKHKVVIWQPPKGAARARWLRRAEAARLLWATRGRVWDPALRGWKTDPATGKRVLRDKAAVERRRPIARLIVLGLKTGSRLGDLLACRWSPRKGQAYVDFDLARMFRQGSGPRRTRKRAPPVLLVPGLLHHLRCWSIADQADPAVRNAGADLVVHDGYGQFFSRNAVICRWNAVRDDAGLGADVNRHTMRHTAVTWLLEGGCSEAGAAAFIGVTLELLMKVYAKVDTAFTKAAARAFDRKARADAAVFAAGR